MSETGQSLICLSELSDTMRSEVGTELSFYGSTVPVSHAELDPVYSLEATNQRPAGDQNPKEPFG